MLNKVMIIGNLGADPELKYTQSQTPVCSFNVGTTKKFKDRSGQAQEKTQWHRVVCWQKLAENCSKYLAKGRKVYIEGELETRSYEDQQGVKRYVTEIVAFHVQFLSSPHGHGQGGGGQTRHADPGSYEHPAGDYQPGPGDDPDIPF